MYVAPGLIATPLEEASKRPFALGLRPHEYGPSWLDQAAAPHRRSADPGNAAQHAGAVLGIEAGVAAQAANVLGAMHTGGAAVILLDDEYLLLFQIVEQADVVRCDKELRIACVAFLGPEPTKYLASDVYVKVSVQVVENGKSGVIERPKDLRQQVEQAPRPTGFVAQDDRYVESEVVEPDVFLAVGATNNRQVVNSQVAALDLCPDPVSEMGVFL